VDEDLAIPKAVKVYYTTINGTNDVRQKNVRIKVVKSKIGHF